LTFFYSNFNCYWHFW